MYNRVDMLCHLQSASSLYQALHRVSPILSTLCFRQPSSSTSQELKGTVSETGRIPTFKTTTGAMACVSCTRGTGTSPLIAMSKKHHAHCCSLLLKWLPSTAIFAHNETSEVNIEATEQFLSGWLLAPMVTAPDTCRVDSRLPN